MPNAFPTWGERPIVRLAGQDWTGSVRTALNRLQMAIMDLMVLRPSWRASGRKFEKWRQDRGRPMKQRVWGKRRRRGGERLIDR